MSSIKYQAEVVLPSKGSQRLDVASPSPQMHADDTCGAGCDQPPGFVRIDGVGAWVYVAENGRDPLPVKGVGRRDKGEGRQNYVA